MAQLPDLHVSDSSEAMLSGRKPPFRLLVRAVASDGRKVNIRHAVSEGFVVCTTLHAMDYACEVHDTAEAMSSGLTPFACAWTRSLVLQVATRRTRTAGKVEIPNVDDHVSKLEHMGKETVKKLQDIRTAAVQAGVEINVPDNCILKGGFSFRARALQRAPR